MPYAALTAVSPYRRLLAAVALLVAGTGVMQAATAAPGSSVPKNYRVAASPAVVPLPAAATATVSIVLTNCDPCDGVRSSMQPFGSAQVRFRATAPLDLTKIHLPPKWSAIPVAGASDETVLQLRNSGTGTTYAIPPGQALTMTLPVTASATAGQIDFSTQVKQSNDFSGTGNEFTRIGPDPTVYLGSGPATHLAFGQQPTNVQGTQSGGTQSGGTGLTPILTTCASVRALDALGGLATSFTGTVTLTPSDSGLGLALGGTTPVAANAVAGVATFGSGAGCTGGLSATKLGFGYTLTASSGTLATGTSDAFDVLQIYGSCGTSCATPSITGTETTASAQATGGSSHPLTFDVGRRSSTAYTGICNPDVRVLEGNPYREVVTVDLDDHSKTVTVLWSKKAVQWAINNGASRWQVCVAAAFSFHAVGGDARSAGDGFFVGALLPCGSAGLASIDPCLLKLNKTSGGQQQAVVSLPLRPGDPKMY